MRFHVITLFPEMFDSYLKESILGRAIKEKKISVSFVNPRKFVSGKYKKVWPDGNVSRQVDDRPYAGGPGMVMMAEPIIKAVEAVTKKILHPTLRAPLKRGIKPKTEVIIINFIPSAEKFNTKIAKNFAEKYTDIIMICGRYEGIDSRVKKVLHDMKYVIKDLSVGDYVLTGGEIPAMILIDSVSRQIEGVLGNFDSREEERVSSSEIYTRPEVLVWPPSSKTSASRSKKRYKVPSVLLSGDHKKIEEWKKIR